MANAKAACDKAGAGYEVYNSKGVAIYPEVKEAVSTSKTTFKIGDAVKLLSGATYDSGLAIPSWVMRSKLYVRDIRKNGDIVISTQKTGAVTGVVAGNFLAPYSSSVTQPGFASYLVKINADVLNVRAGAGTNYKINTQVRRNEVYTIIAESGRWGKLKSGAGWIHLDYVKKV